MVTNLLEDSVPTTTINFQTFTEITETLVAENFTPFAYPENEGREIIHPLQWFHTFTIYFRLRDDDTFPVSGDSAADKWLILKTLIKSGGDNEGVLTLTFDSEDSTPAAPQTETYDGRVRNIRKTTEAGTHKRIIEGKFEFWVQVLS